MFYVVIIILLSLAAWPLRTVLRQESDPFGGSESLPWLGVADRAAVLLGYSACFLVSYVCYLGVDMDLIVQRLEASGSQWSGYTGPMFKQLFHYIAHSLGLGVLTALHVYMRKEPNGVLTWTLFFYIYVPLVGFPAAFAYAPQCAMLYLLGVVAFIYPFTGGKAIRSLVRAYWLLLLPVYLILAMPALIGRCDIYPPLTM